MEFSKTEACQMYRILEEIHSGLTDKKNFSNEKLSLFEFASLNSIENFFKSKKEQGPVENSRHD